MLSVVSSSVTDGAASTPSAAVNSVSVILLNQCLKIMLDVTLGRPRARLATAGTALSTQMMGI